MGQSGARAARMEAVVEDLRALGAEAAAGGAAAGGLTQQLAALQEKVRDAAAAGLQRGRGAARDRARQAAGM